MVEVEDFLGESKQREKRHLCKHSDHIETKNNHPGQPEHSIFTLHFYVYSTLYICFFLEYVLCLQMLCGMWSIQSGEWKIDDLTERLKLHRIWKKTKTFKSK